MVAAFVSMVQIVVPIVEVPTGLQIIIDLIDLKEQRRGHAQIVVKRRVTTKH